MVKLLQHESISGNKKSVVARVDFNFSDCIARIVASYRLFLARLPGEFRKGRSDEHSQRDLSYQQSWQINESMIHVLIALDEYGVSFIPGERNNPRVLEYFHSCGQDWVTNDDTPWCAAFLNFVLKKAGMEHSGRLNARSFLEVGVETKIPQMGDLVILWRGSKEGALGHCGIFIKEIEHTIYILGGNEGGKVQIEGFSDANVLGFRKISNI